MLVHESKIKEVKEKLKREKIFLLFLFLGLFLIAFVCITLGNMFYKQAEDFSGLIDAAKDPVVLTAAICSTLIAFFFGVPLAYFLFVNLPFLVDAAREGFKEVDPRLENVARSLGDSHWRTFIKITSPLAFSSIFSGAVLCWARGISEFAAVMIVAYYPISAPILIYEKFTSFGLDASRPISVLLISICLVIFVLLRILQRRSK